MNKATMLAAAFGLAAMMTGGSARSADWSSQPNPVVTVRYSDLDLASPRGQAVLRERIREAAFEACGVYQGSIPDYRRSVRRSACYRAGVEEAMARLNLAPGAPG